MDFVSKKIQDYCENLSTPEDEVLNELNRETGTPEKYKCEYYVLNVIEN